MKLPFIFIWNFYFVFINKTPLHIAIEKGDANVVKFLLKNKFIDVNLKSILIYIFSYSFFN